MESDDRKIEAAATVCLNQCNGSRMPWKTASRFIDTLKISKDWTDAEIVEVQRKVIAVLLQERVKN